MDRQIDRSLVSERFIPSRGKMRLIAPRAALGGFNQLHSNVLGLSQGVQSLKISGVSWILHQHEIIRQQDRIKIKLFQAALMNYWRTQCMAGNTDEANQALLPGLHNCRQSTPG